MVAAHRTADWDLAPYFTGVTAADFVAFRDRLAVDAGALRRRGEELGPIAGDPGAWGALLAALEEVGVRLRHVSSYLSCVTAADAGDEAARTAEAGLDTIETELDKAEVRVRAALAAADDEAFAALCGDPRLAGAEHYLRRM